MEFYKRFDSAEKKEEYQRNRLPLEVQEKYHGIDVIEVDGIPFTGYYEYSVIEEKSYKESPYRSEDGIIHKINDYETFLTTRIIIKYSMMHIDDYRRLANINRGKKNGFSITFYDIVSDSRITKEMYFAPFRMPTIYQRNLIALGVQDFEIELIGTDIERDS